MQSQALSSLRIHNQRITDFNCQGSVEACGCSKHVSGIAGADWLSLGGSAWENCVRSPYVWEIKRLGHTGTSVIDIRRMSWSRNGNSGFHPLNPLQYYEIIVRFGVDSMIRGPSEQDLCKRAECAVGIYDDMRQEVSHDQPKRPKIEPNRKSAALSGHNRAGHCASVPWTNRGTDILTGRQAKNGAGCLPFWFKIWSFLLRIFLPHAHDLLPQMATYNE